MFPIWGIRGIIDTVGELDRLQALPGAHGGTFLPPCFHLYHARRSPAGMPIPATRIAQDAAGEAEAGFPPRDGRGRAWAGLGGGRCRALQVVRQVHVLAARRVVGNTPVRYPVRVVGHVEEH